MSCFESSEFLANPETMNPNILEAACVSLGWKYSRDETSITVWELGAVNNTSEYILKVTGNRVSYNTYYFKDGIANSNILKTEFEQLNRKYSMDLILKSFQKVGFSFQKNRQFQPSEELAESFFMVGRSQLKSETERVAKIRFDIRMDGSFISDSYYIPEDIHALADKAMEEISSVLGRERKISPKEIPLKYKHKAFCHQQTKNTVKRK